MDPIVGETLACVRAVEVALLKNWTNVIFETDSILLEMDLGNPHLPPRWKVEDMVLSLCQLFKAQSAWSLHWVPRRLNQQAYLLAQWAARSSVSGFVSISCIPFSILSCDVNSVFQ